MKVLFLVPPSKHAKNVARDLIYGCWCKGKRIAGLRFPPMTLAIVATIVRNDGSEVKLLDAAGLGLTWDETLDQSSGFDAAVLLTSTMTVNEDAEVLAGIKERNPAMKTIVYGGHAKTMAAETVQRAGIDFAIAGEADFIIQNLIACLRDGKDYSALPGLAFLDEKGIPHVNEKAPFVQDLNEFPIPDRTLLSDEIDYFNPIVRRMPYTTMFTSRGCPAQCTFCASPAFYGSKVRMQSAERVAQEMEEVARLGYKEVFFRDETFTASKKRIMELCEILREKKLDLTWICSSRVTTIDKEMMIAMKEVGCHLVRFGVESGVQEILDNVKKGITVERTRQVFKWIHEVGLDTHAHCMVGMPGETKETLERTFRFVMEIKPTIVTFGICTPYPGTPLFEELLEKYPELKEKVGDGSSSDLENLHTSSFFNEYFQDLTPEELSGAIRRIYRRFYMRPSYVLGWLFRMTSFSQFKRVTMAGAEVFDFIFGKN